MTDGRLAYRLKTQWRDGTTHVVMERRELLERLAPLIPPPRAHQVRYHGVLAPCSSARDQVVPAGSETLETALSSGESGGGSIGAADGGRASLGADPPIDLRGDRRESLPRRIAWAELLKRVFEVDALRCPAWGGRMRLLAAITNPVVARRILECLALPPRAPPLAPAPAQSDSGFDFDQSPSEDRFSNEDS